MWRAVLAELAQVLTSENFNTWLAGKVLQALQALDDERLHERAERVTRIAYVVGVA